jgi:hypothetical protein
LLRRLRQAADAWHDLASLQQHECMCHPPLLVSGACTCRLHVLAGHSAMSTLCCAAAHSATCALHLLRLRVHHIRLLCLFAGTTAARGRQFSPVWRLQCQQRHAQQLQRACSLTADNTQSIRLACSTTPAACTDSSNAATVSCSRCG